jgi:hypothetical protein
VQSRATATNASRTEITKELTELQAAKATLVRLPVEWRVLEWTAGRIESGPEAELDFFLNEAAARGIKVLATVATTPPWANAGKGWNYAPTSSSAITPFAKWLATRYGTKLAGVEVWNEPEIDSNLIPPSGITLAASYVGLVKAVHQGLQEGNPAVKTIAGSLSYADLKFLRELYADGLRGQEDGVSCHPYADGAAPENMTVTHSFKRGIEEVHAAQLAAGDTTAEWVTEFGWSNEVSEAVQAEDVEHAFTKVLRTTPYVAGASIYQLRNNGTGTGHEENFGLLTESFAPKLAWAAFRRALSG